MIVASKVNVAVIGSGFGSLVHLPGYLLHDRFNVIGFYGRTPEKTEQIAKIHNIKAYKSLDEVVQDPDIDLISIASIPCEHFFMAEKAILNKKHVILEKPMALNSEQSLLLLNLAKENNIFHAVVHEHRFDPSKQYSRFLIKNKVYGDLRSIEITKHMTYWRDIYSGRNYDWFSDKSLGGGMIGAHLSHLVDFLNFIDDGLIRYICGRAYIENKKRLDRETNSIMEQTAEDTVYAIAETVSGKPAVINLSASRFKENSKFKIFTSEAEILILGQNSIIITDKNRNFISNEVPEKFQIKYFNQDFRMNTFVNFLDRFYLHYFKALKQDISTFEDGHNIQLMLEKIEYINNN